jgi:hypothetical protein
MPAIGINVMLTGRTDETVKNIDGNSVLQFYIEENLGEKEPRDFWIEVRHSANYTYLANKTNSVNQSMRSTSAILIGVIYYEHPMIDQSSGEEISSDGKHILELDDISLIPMATNRSNTSSQSVNLPWMNQNTSGASRNRTPRGATPRRSRGGRVTLSQMSPTTNTLTSALEANPLPNMDLLQDETVPPPDMNISQEETSSNINTSEESNISPDIDTSQESTTLDQPRRKRGRRKLTT